MESIIFKYKLLLITIQLHQPLQLFLFMNLMKFKLSEPLYKIPFKLSWEYNMIYLPLNILYFLVK